MITLHLFGFKIISNNLIFLSFNLFFPLGMNDTEGKLTKTERKRQQAIEELINTEESYNTDMQMALEVCEA